MSVKRVLRSPPIPPPMLTPTEIDPAWGLAAVVDTETTGLNPEKDEVIEIAIILFAFDRETYEIKGIVDEYVGQREPNRSIPRAATEKHGLTKRMLKGKDFDYRRLHAICAKAEFLVAYNAEFDEQFCKGYVPRKPWYCCMKNIVWSKRTDRWQKLETLLKRHNITDEQIHRAGDDARKLLTLLSLKNESGNTYFGEMMTTVQKHQTALKRWKQGIKTKKPENEQKQQSKAAGCGCFIIVAILILIASLLHK